jgi:hypothetical protein
VIKRAEPASDELPLDYQQVESLGRNRIKAALIEAGLKVAPPSATDIDLMAYRWNLDGDLVARPIQINALVQLQPARHPDLGRPAHRRNRCSTRRTRARSW